jgi:transcriptional regulator with XRE-family HTH domain
MNEPIKETKGIDPLEITFGRVLRQSRRERGLSQEELGFRSGYHRTYISLLERGLKSPSLRTIFQLADALEIAPSEMILSVQSLFEKAPRNQA